MKSTPGSDLATPLQGQVKFVPSIRNWFSFVPDPNAEMVVTVPLDGEVGDTPGAALIASNMLDRRVGMTASASGPNRVPIPGLRASMREPAASTTIDSAIPATFSTTVRSIVAPAPISMSSMRSGAKPGIVTSRAYDPGDKSGNRHCPLWLVTSISGPTRSDAELT